MTYIVYVLRSIKDQDLYIGMTGNLDRRFLRHQRGHVRSTSHRRPFQLIHQESFLSRAEAAKRERFLKSGPGHRQLSKILKNRRGSSS